MDDSSPHELLDQMNLTGQSQPSLPSLPPDPMLDNQILNDILLDPEMFPLTPLIENSPSDDGISSALVDNIIEDFDSSLLTGINMPDLVPEILSTPQHSTIEETMEGIHLSQSQTDYSSVSSAILTGSSPVEHTIIDNSILSNRHINQPKRLNKSAAKRHRHTDYQRPSTTVAPFNDSSSSSSCQASATVQMQSESLWSSQNEQWDSTDSLKIKIAAQPRARFRPRTQNESRNASHFIRCDASSSYDYPTIIIPRRWSLESHENLIEVTLVKQDHQPHRYTISNKNAKNEYQSDALIFRNNGDHTLFYRVTDSDFTQGYKSFQIEFVKSKQGGEITKELIRNEQLEHSKLRFTRIYLDKQNNYQRDEASTEYSSLMSEAYGDVAVEHFGPRYGSKVGEMVYVLMKGHVAKNDVIIEVSESVSGMYERPSFNKTGNMIFFTMPNATMIMGDEVTAEVKIYYKTEPLYETSYIYAGAVDDLLNRLHISDANRADGNGSFGNVYHATNFFAATGALPTSTRSNTSRTVKRLQKKK